MNIEVDEIVVSIIRDNVQDSTIVNNDSRLIHDLRIDSLSLVHLAADLEKAFKISISDHEIRSTNFHSVAHVIQFIKGKLS